MRSQIQKTIRAVVAEYGTAAAARAYGCSPTQMRRVARGDSGASVDGMYRLSRWCAKQGDTRLSRLFTYESDQAVLVLVDGSCDDEALSLQEASVDIRRAHRRGDYQSFVAALKRMRLAVAGAEAEGQAKFVRVAK